MLKIDVIKFEAQDVITTSVAQNAVAVDGTCYCTENCIQQDDYHNIGHKPCTPGFCKYEDSFNNI